ncbi:protein of unknown function [Bradyrhizobium vignae]|uniref:Uncharacterized protein n=1 Tax=Bradyrhizobium vignae TaxID=1549949 RepID=A0A2U3PWK6_9BRAD|nr:protein of unknown function [Bradyrhizobium vignae]
MDGNETRALFRPLPGGRSRVGAEASPFPAMELPAVELGRHKENSSKSRDADFPKTSIK